MEEKNISFIKRFYGDQVIHKLILEQAKNYDYCIGTGQILVDRGWTLPVKEVEISKIEELINDGLDLFFPIRCSGDKDLYIIWDIDYFNKKEPQFIFDRKNQKQIFEWMSSALETIEEILNSFGIKYVVDVTLSGIHIWSKISTESEAFRKLSSEGYILPSLEKKYSQVVAGDRKRLRPVSSELGKSYNAVGKVLEYFTHLLIKKNRKLNSPQEANKIPVTISDTPQYGKSFPLSGISSDLTQYAHPIYMRCIRAICSVHQKSLINGHFNLGSAIDIVKTKGITYSDILDIMWDVDKTIKHFKKNFTKKKLKITESSEGWLNAINGYKKSDLRKKHKQWEKTTVSSTIPVFDNPDIKKLFDNSLANPSLLVPSNLQFIADYFTKNGGVSATKKMFSVIAEYYNNENLKWYDPIHFTGIDWNKYDAETAADFWGRVYWSLNVSKLGRKYF
ncbi:MAG: hypothetical protein V1833_00440 [Elusimicrobiota bacterium]